MTDWASLPGRLRAAGLAVVEVAGWLSRGRPGTYTPRGVLLHHTAGPRRGNAPSLGVVTEGRPGIPGPLSQALVARDATWYLVAAGRANHAGKGSSLALAEMIAGGGWQDPAARRGLPNDTGSGNRWLYGVEVENTGVGEPWSTGLVDSVVTGTAVVQQLLGVGPGHGGEHRGYSSRKIDPAWSVSVRLQLEVAHRELGRWEDDDMARLVQGDGTIYDGSTWWAVTGVTKKSVRWPEVDTGVKLGTLRGRDDSPYEPVEVPDGYLARLRRVYGEKSEDEIVEATA